MTAITEDIDREARDFVIDRVLLYLDCQITDWEFCDAISGYLDLRAGISPDKKHIRHDDCTCDSIITKAWVWGFAYGMYTYPIKLEGDFALDEEEIAKAKRLITFLKSDREYVDPPFQKGESLFAWFWRHLRNIGSSSPVSAPVEEDYWPFLSKEDYLCEMEIQEVQKTAISLRDSCDHREKG